MENNVIEEKVNEAKVGDVVACQGLRVKIKEIISQYTDWDFNPVTGERTDYMAVEFIDHNDVYRYWKQRFDGGKLISKKAKEEAE